jgi:hypothetical protein
MFQLLKNIANFSIHCKDVVVSTYKKRYNAYISYYEEKRIQEEEDTKMMKFSIFVLVRSAVSVYMFFTRYAE